MVPSIRTLALSLSAVFLACCVLGRQAQAYPLRPIRVLIMSDAVTLKIRVDGPFRVSDIPGGKTIKQGVDWDGSMTIKDNNLTVSGKSVKSRRILIAGDDAESITLNDRRYRGTIEVARKDRSHFLVINILDLESYVKGIAIREVSHYWPAEALKAHAVVFRSYALYQMQHRAGQLYDVSSDVYSQVYGGREAERYRITDAVDDTKGEIIVYKGRVVPAFFHSTCAGHTEDARQLWNISMEPLEGVDCDYCKDSPHYSWKTVIKDEEIAKAMTASGKPAGRIKDIRVFGRNRSQRATDIVVESSRGDILISAKQLRQALGADRIKSAKFNVSKKNREYVFEGTGWGHGVGLCQWGAYFMSKSGFSYKEILSYYYPQSQLSDIRP